MLRVRRWAMDEFAKREGGASVGELASRRPRPVALDIVWCATHRQRGASPERGLIRGVLTTRIRIESQEKATQVTRETEMSVENVGKGHGI